MITLFNVKKHKVDEHLYELLYIDGDVDINETISMLRYAVVGTREVYKLVVNINDIYDNPNYILSNYNNDEICKVLRDKLSPKVQSGFWFNLKVEDIVKGATVYKDQLGIEEYRVESIGFGESEGEAKKDAINRALRKLSFLCYKGLIHFDSNDFDIPYYKNIKCISGKELRKYIVDNYVNPNKQEAPKQNNKSQENNNNSAENKALIEEISKLKQENKELIGENASLTDEKKALQSKIQELENKLSNIKQAISFLKNI